MLPQNVMLTVGWFWSQCCTTSYNQGNFRWHTHSGPNTHQPSRIYRLQRKLQIVMSAKLYGRHWDRRKDGTLHITRTTLQKNSLWLNESRRLLGYVTSRVWWHIFNMKWLTSFIYIFKLFQSLVPLCTELRQVIFKILMSYIFLPDKLWNEQLSRQCAKLMNLQY